MSPILHISKTAEELADTFARQLNTWIIESKEDKFHLALSGGKTPSLLFSLLADKYANEVPWNKIHFWWGDERMVPADNPESNFGEVNKLLFSKIGVMPSQIHPIKGENDAATEANRYGSEISLTVPIKNNLPSFDLIMLGLGEDGHTASIFPGQMHLMDSIEVTGIASHPISGQKRITLTGTVINNSKRVVFLVSGASKSKIFKEIIQLSPKALQYPAAHIQPFGELYWFIDEKVWS